jgi:hypothetical protein
MALDDLAYVRALKLFTRGDLQFLDLPLLELELYGPNDRASAVLMASTVEAALTAYIGSKIRNDLNSDDRRLLFDQRGPLGTFSSKIIVAHALNWIGPITRNDLDLIRLLRNEFAHSRKSFGFTAPEVKAVCDHLQIPEQSGSYIPSGYSRGTSPEELAALSDITKPKTRFIVSSHSLAYRLIVARLGPRAGDIAFPDDNPVP